MLFQGEFLWNSFTFVTCVYSQEVILIQSSRTSLRQKIYCRDYFLDGHVNYLISVRGKLF